MQKTILMIVAVAVVGCASTPEIVPNSPEAKAAIEAAIRKAANKPTGELTKADFEKLAKLNLDGNKLTSVRGLEKLTQLKDLNLGNNKLTDVTGLEKLTQLTHLSLWRNQLTNVKGLEKLTQLKVLNLWHNSDLTKDQVAGLKKALPKCHIQHNPKK